MHPQHPQHPQNPVSLLPLAVALADPGTIVELPSDLFTLVDEYARPHPAIALMNRLLRERRSAGFFSPVTAMTAMTVMTAMTAHIVNQSDADVLLILRWFAYEDMLNGANVEDEGVSMAPAPYALRQLTIYGVEHLVRDVPITERVLAHAKRLSLVHLLLKTFPINVDALGDAFKNALSYDEYKLMARTTTPAERLVLNYLAERDPEWTEIRRRLIKRP
jgi:hypothetical protein